MAQSTLHVNRLEVWRSKGQTMAARDRRRHRGPGRGTECQDVRHRGSVGLQSGLRMEDGQKVTARGVVSLTSGWYSTSQTHSPRRRQGLSSILPRSAPSHHCLEASTSSGLWYHVPTLGSRNTLQSLSFRVFFGFLSGFFSASEQLYFIHVRLKVRLPVRWITS